MEILLLGTGAADGWPNAFCRCVSCEEARRAGVLRHQTAALVDGRLLFDCGADAPASAARRGADLADVTDVFITHAHSDHCAPAFLLHRGWVTDAPLTLHGPPAVIATCRDWVAPDQDVVTLHEVSAGDVVATAAGEVTVLPAAHWALGDAVLYALCGRRGSLLYATDTGPLPERALELVRSAAFDAVLLEETFGHRFELAGDHHLHLGTFAETLEALRGVGAVTDSTTVVPVHLSHHNPPPHALAADLAALGVRLYADGDVIRIP